MNFEHCIGPVLRREGGYVNHSLDKGGATNLGITQAVYDDWRRQRGLMMQSVKLLTVEEAKVIYHSNYWVEAKCDQLPPGIREIHFDSAINHGVGAAAKMLQRACGADVDGVIGQKTLAAVGLVAPELLKSRYVNARYRLYGKIIERDRTQLAFMVGWMKRMEEFA